MENKELLMRIEELENELSHHKNYDWLTNVYNKYAFYQLVDDLIHHHTDMEFDIICADIENFKLINDIYGTQLGDLLLKRIAEDLKRAFPLDTMICSRLESDIFAICLPRSYSGENTANQIYQIFHSYSNEMEIISAIGIYSITNIHMAVSLMCDRAIMAANSVKGIYMKHYAYFNDQMRNILLEEHELLNEAETGILNHEFKVYMQPKCNMITGKITGAEALVRWYHPKKGLIPPMKFIPFFERNGFIKKLDQYVWEECAKWLHEWSKHHEVIPISVNISRVDIFSLNLHQIFQNLVQTYMLQPHWLELEITESAYSSKNDEIIHAINHLMNHGFTILMDDFGSGYSSLNILKDIQIDILKLDMKFLDNQDKKSKDIIESVVHMARWLDLKIIAEGVENKEQIDFLLKVGCNYAQGYYYYKPMPLDEFEHLLSQEHLVDYHDHLHYRDRDMTMIHLKDLFHDDLVTETMMNHILGAVALYRFHDNQLILQKGNESYHRLKESDIQGCNVLNSVHPDDVSNLLTALQHAREERDHGSEVILRCFLQDNNIIWLKVRLFFLSETKGSQIFYASLSDISEYMKTLEAQRMSEKSFHIAMQASNIAIFELDIATRTAYYSKHTQEAFGLQDCVMNAPQGFIDEGSVAEGYEDIFCDMYEKIYQGSDQASCIIKANMADGTSIYNRITLTAIKDEFGKPVKAVGMVECVNQDIVLQN